jgi:stage V sporulation protein SpoVS
MGTFLVVEPSSVRRELADAIATAIRQGEPVTLLAYGTGSIFQAVTAIGLSRAELVRDGLDIHFVTDPPDLDAEGNERTALSIFAAQPGSPFPPPNIHAAE